MAAVGRRDSFMNNSIPLCVFLLIIMMSASSCKAITNVLLKGQILDFWQNKLSYANSNVSLVMKFNCNLVLYDDKGHVQWESKTGGSLRWYCTLSFTDNGRLVITDNSGEQYWISSNANSAVGEYVAVLRPEGQLSIYGPAIWAEGPEAVKERRISRSSSDSDINSNEMVSSMANLKNSPIVDNVLFSGQILDDNGKISGNGSLIMRDTCELVLENSGGKISWRSWTNGNGKNCFARLDHRGGLAILDDAYSLVWRNKLALPAPTGKYVLVMQSDGRAVIYGPEVWSTEDPKSGFIEMPTIQM